MEWKKGLEVSYQREMRQNYMMIAAEESAEQGYESKMLLGNTIEGLLKFRIRKSDTHCQFCYEITSKQPLGRMLETKTIGLPTIRNLLLGIAETLNRMEEYLLAEELIILEPDFIYVNPENFQPGLCLMPGKKGNFPQEFSDFLQFLLGKVDHQDKEAVVLVYGLYQESLKENYGLDNLLGWLIKKDCPDLENTGEAGKFEKIRKTDFSIVSELPNPVGRKERGEELRAAEDRQTKGNASKEDDRCLRKPENHKLPGKRNFCLIAISVLILAALWFWRGAAAVKHYGFYVIISTALCAAANAALSAWYQKRQGEEMKDEQADVKSQETWQMIFAEEVPDMENSHEEERRGKEREDPVTEQDREASHTVLLWRGEKSEESHCLISQDGKHETIPLVYYPFLIGKQENLTDYQLNRETVSRLHVRIDRSGDTYTLTDLNSTNGTAVNGKKLEANETVELLAGDMIAIADIQFRFQ